MRISKVVIPVAIALLVFFAAFTIYGNKVGNFVVNVDKQGPNIAVSMEEDLSDATSRISVSGLDEQDLATYTNIPKNISEGLGLKSDYEKYMYFAVSFYIVNLSERTVDYDVTMTILDNIGVAEDIIRVLIIEGDVEKDEGSIYAMAEESDEEKEKLASHISYEAIDFAADDVVMAKRVNDFHAGDRVKYTVVLWMEGWDVLADDNSRGSRIKMEMNFKAY